MNHSSGLAWVRCSSRPVSYLTRWDGQKALWAVAHEGGPLPWRAYCNGFYLRAADGTPLCFPALERAMGFCERQAAKEAEDG